MTTWTEWLTAGSLLVAAIYAWLTWRIAKANNEVVQAMREQTIGASRPYVTMRVLTESILFRLEIKNTGQTQAERLRLTLDQDFFQFGDKSKGQNLATFSAFTEEIACLPPGGSLIFHLATSPSFFGEESNPKKCPSVFTIKASYGFFGRRVEESTTIDVRPYFNSSAAEDPVVARLKEIRDAIEKAARK